MTVISDERPATLTAAPVARPRLLLRDLDRPGAVFANLGPNWFSTVMGTGVVGGAAASLPVAVPGLRVFATVVWGLASVLLVVLVAAWASTGCVTPPPPAATRATR